jgi:hypothetical protein
VFALVEPRSRCKFRSILYRDSTGQQVKCTQQSILPSRTQIMARYSSLSNGYEDHSIVNSRNCVNRWNILRQAPLEPLPLVLTSLGSSLREKRGSKFYDNEGSCQGASKCGDEKSTHIFTARATSKPQQASPLLSTFAMRCFGKREI